MFKFIIFYFVSLVVIQEAWGQKDIYLNVNHYLGKEKFELQKNTTNNLDHRFHITRIDYFISNITLYHDNGIATSFPDTYILSRNGEDIRVNIGRTDIIALDSISFLVGIDSINNHGDPTLWPADHALAPKSPDMHWGWASGYRFVAIEGNSGPELLYNFQIHSVGDFLIQKVVIQTNGQLRNDQLHIDLDADIGASLTNINMNKVVFIHGSTKEAVALMNNFKNKVFKASSPISSVSDTKLNYFKLSPNPSLTESSYIFLEKNAISGDKITIKDISGRIVQQIQNPDMSNEIYLSEPGVYFIELLRNNLVLQHGKLIKL